MEFYKTWLNKRQYFFHEDESLKEAFVEWVQSINEEGLDAIKVKGFQLFVETQVK